MEYQDFPSVAQLSDEVKNVALDVTMNHRYSGTLPAYANMTAPEGSGPEFTPKPASKPSGTLCEAEAFLGTHGDDKGGSAVIGSVGATCGRTTFKLEKTEDETTKLSASQGILPNVSVEGYYESNGVYTVGLKWKTTFRI